MALSHIYSLTVAFSWTRFTGFGFGGMARRAV